MQDHVVLAKQLLVRLDKCFPLDPVPSVDEWGNDEHRRNCSECEDIFHSVACKNWKDADITDWDSTWTFLPKPTKPYYFIGYLYRMLNWIILVPEKDGHETRTMDIGNDWQISSMLGDITRGNCDFQLTIEQRGLFCQILKLIIKVGETEKCEVFRFENEYRDALHWFRGK
jgi:hypothetical protein